MGHNDPAGAIWNKWDLHVHTPRSMQQEYGGDTEQAWQEFFLDLESLPPEFKVIGINDYIFVDGYERVLKAKNDEGRLKNIDLILPVVELRLDKFSGVIKFEEGKATHSAWSRINLHVVFDQIAPELIRQQFLNGLANDLQLTPDAHHLQGRWNAIVTPESLAQLGQLVIDAAPDSKSTGKRSPLREGFNNICFSFEKIKQALRRHELADRHFLAVGKTEWQELKWDDHSIAEKLNVINSADLVFTAAASPKHYADGRAKLISSKVNDRLFDCSDAHALSTSTNKDRIGNCFTWIKADTTFAGLRQALTEFEDRVYVGDTPPKKLLVDNNRTKYIKRLKVAKKVDSNLKDAWFEVDLPLGHDLVAIIGNKGSGKSALADIAALAGNTSNHAEFSFLTNKRFRSQRQKFAQHFVGHLEWADGTKTFRSLDENPPEGQVERVKYLPQSYIENLCNELGGDGGSATFDRELRKIIYTHVPEDERLSFPSMDSLLEFKVSEIDAAKERVRGEMRKLNADILAVEERSTQEYRESLQARLNAKKAELAALEQAKPAEVQNPAAEGSGQEEAAAFARQIDVLEATAKGLRLQEQELRDEKVLLARRLAMISRATQSLLNHQKAHELFLSELDGLLGGIDSTLDAANLARLAIDTAPLSALETVARARQETIDKLLAVSEADSVSVRRAAAETAIEEIKGRLGEKQRLFVVYQEQVEKWQRAKSDLAGLADKPNTIAGLTADIAALAGLPSQLVNLRAQRAELVRRLHALLMDTAAEYRRLYQPVREFVRATQEMGMALPLDFDVSIVESGFGQEFLEMLNRQVRGTFSGIAESERLMRSWIRETDFNDVDAVLRFLDRIEEALRKDKREGLMDEDRRFADQLRSGVKAEDVREFLFGLQYLSPRYSLTYDGQEIGQLSPGERGLLLLVFYLLVDKDDIPLIIDQPEENLDNQTIYKVLVKCIKKAKERRQVIMVTHNPNLAVVCDAEQIICASREKPDNRFNYVSGAIEAPVIMSTVVDILEGTQPAFKNRESKYRL